MRRALAILLVLVCCGWCHAQSTRPAEAEWADAVAEFTESFMQGGTRHWSMLWADSVMRPLDQRREALPALMVRAAGGVLVAKRAYAGVPTALASDIAESVADAGLPEDLTRRLALPDKPAADRANATAAQWMADALDVQPGEPCAMLVFWCDGPPADELRPAPSAQRELVFILLKGQQAQPGQYRIGVIAFGNPLQRRN